MEIMQSFTINNTRQIMAADADNEQLRALY